MFKGVASKAAHGRALFSTSNKIPLFINGKFLDSKTDKWLPVHNPATGQVISHCPQATPAELKSATDAAAAAFPAWRNTPVTARQRHMFELQALIRKNEKELIDAVVTENGKVVADAKVTIFFSGSESSCCFVEQRGARALVTGAMLIV